MAYKLTTSEKSPFGRICRMFLIQHNIPFQAHYLNFVDDKVAAAELAKITPINKVPILHDGDQMLFDSRVIINHLIRKHDLPKLTLDEENMVSAIYGALDAGVILFLMKKDGLDLEKSPFFVQRNRGRIPNALNFIESWVKTLDPQSDWNYASMALYSFLDWAEKRMGGFRVSDYPVMAAFKSQFANAPGVHETNFS